MTHRPTVLLDCDGPLSDFVGYAVGVVRRVTGIEATPEMVTRYDFCEALGLSARDAMNVKQVIGDDVGAPRRMRVQPGAREGVERLRDVADVYVVTSPWNSNRTWMYEREHWLQKHFDIPPTAVIHAHAKAKRLVRGDIFVDDRLSTVQAWKLGSLGHSVLWRTLHNATDEWTPATNNWDELRHLALMVAYERNKRDSEAGQYPADAR